MFRKTFRLGPLVLALFVAGLLLAGPVFVAEAAQKQDAPTISSAPLPGRLDEAKTLRRDIPELLLPQAPQRDFTFRLGSVRFRLLPEPQANIPARLSLGQDPLHRDHGIYLTFELMRADR